MERNLTSCDRHAWELGRVPRSSTLSDEVAAHSSPQRALELGERVHWVLLGHSNSRAVRRRALADLGDREVDKKSSDDKHHATKDEETHRDPVERR